MIMLLKLMIGVVCLGVAFLVYCCCRVAGEADARLEALEERIQEDDTGNPH